VARYPEAILVCVMPECKSLLIVTHLSLAIIARLSGDKKRPRRSGAARLGRLPCRQESGCSGTKLPRIDGLEAKTRQIAVANSDLRAGHEGASDGRHKASEQGGRLRKRNGNGLGHIRFSTC